MKEGKAQVKVSRLGDKVRILTEHPSETVRLGASLRAVLGDTAVVAVKGGYAVPLEASASLAKILPPGDHEWDEELRASGSQVLDIAQAQSNAKVEVAEALEAPYVALGDYEEVFKLDPHQVEAVAAMTVPSLQGMALFDEQGVGKTVCALAAFDVLKLRGKVTHLLVVAPKSVLTVWQDECQRVFNSRYKVALLTGKQATPLSILKGQNYLFLLSYEAVTRGAVILKGLASTKDRKFMLVVDESYYVKNPSARRSKAVAQLRRWCVRAYVLCGTPAPNSPADVIHQIDITDGGKTFAGLTVPNDQDLAASLIQEALGNSAIFLRRLKGDVLTTLPLKRVKKVLVDLEPVQADMYKRALEDLVLDIRRVDDTYFTKHLSEFMARKWALLQICSNPVGIDSLYSEEPAKITALDEIVKTLVVERGLKVVIWSFFRRSLQAIATRYKNYGIVRVDGTVNSTEERRVAISRFQNDPNVRIFVGSPAAAGAGITLTAASHAVYESFSNQPSHYLQSVDRIHRRGQNNPVTSYILIAQSTIEEREFKKLTEKERRGHDIFGKHPTEPITREGFLKDLLGD